MLPMLCDSISAGGEYRPTSAPTPFATLCACPNPPSRAFVPNEEKPMPKEASVETVAVKMAPSLVAAIDELAQRQHRTRSDVLRQGAIRELEAGGLCLVTR